MRGHGGLYKALTMKDSERLRREGDKIKFIDPIIKRGQVAGFGKEEEGKTFHKLHFLRTTSYFSACVTSL